MAQGPIILAADDEINIQKLICVNLQAEGYRVITASDGVSALTLFKEVNPDLVILDVMMPGMDGYEVIAEIRQKSRVPIIMLTGRDDVNSLRIAMEAGADDYITKPFNVHLLLARVRAKIRRAAYAVNGGAH